VIDNPIDLGPLLSRSYKKTTKVKPGVSELFESNPELANAVYENLGFKTFDNKGVSLDTKERDGWKWIKLNGKNIGEVKLVKNDRRSKEVGLSIKLNEEYQNKGYGQIVHTLVADWAKNEFGDTLYSDFDNSQAEINTLLALTKKGYAEKIGDYGVKENGRYNTDVRAFRIKTSDEIGTITPQQKQQAQQLYSQYLDTIFPDSKVKDIVYRGDGTTLNKAINSTFGTGYYFTPKKSYAESFAEIASARDKGYGLYTAIINLKNPFIYNETAKNYKTIRSKTGKAKDVYKKIAFDKLENNQNIPLLSDIRNEENTTPLYIYKNGKYFTSRGKEVSKEEIIKNIELQVASSLEDVTLVTSEKSDLENINSKLDKSNDGIIVNISEKYDDIKNEYIVFESEQIHILGSKQDIEGFREFANQSTRPQLNNVSTLFNTFANVSDADVLELINECN
jgi:hypothetical protein